MNKDSIPSSILLVVNDKLNIKLDSPGVEIVTADNYLKNYNGPDYKRAIIVNLCNSYRYQSTGYYVSLLGEARGQKVFPDINTILEMRSQALIRIVTKDLDKLIQKSLSGIHSDKYVLSIYFGENIAKKYDALALKIFNLFQAPLLQVDFAKKDTWKITNINIISMKHIPENHHEALNDIAQRYFGKKISMKRRKLWKYSMAILHSADEKTSPSDSVAIKKFIKAGKKYGISSDIIDKDDYNRIPYYDALFIRETTAVNHHTYKFAQRAEAEGVVVIDDPESIMKCTNKVYLTELLSKNKIMIPKTKIITKKTKSIAEIGLEFPIILKKPDSSFSQGVIKVNNEDEYKIKSKELLAGSDLIIAQEFIPTDFDWRVGIIGKEILYVCKYYMAKEHWQIVNWGVKGKNKMGTHQTVDIKNVPKNVLRTALKSANLIGDGLYGVDVKEKDGIAYIIEVNDNPSIDSSVEDRLLKDKLYEKIMHHFVKKIELNKKMK